MPLHILLCDEVLQHFILWVGTLQNLNLIWFQMNMQLVKGLKNKREFLYSKTNLSQNTSTGPARPGRPPPHAAHLPAHSRPSSDAPGCMHRRAGTHWAQPTVPLWSRAASRWSHPTCCGPGPDYCQAGLHLGQRILNKKRSQFYPHANPNQKSLVLSFNSS
jgi:hypothetical protein